MTAHDDAEEIRIRYRYRRMILLGRMRVSLEVAKRLVGPDCAYHLYGSIGDGAKSTSPDSEDGGEPIHGARRAGTESD